MLLDFDSLVRLGRDTEHTLGMVRLFRDPIFWKQKTEMLLKRPLDNRPGANWIRTYQIVLQFLKDVEELKEVRARRTSLALNNWTISIASEIYEDGLVDVTTLSILFDLYPPEKLRGANSKLPEIKLKSLDVFIWLLDNGYIVRDQDVRYVLESTASTDAVEIARYITSSIQVPEETQRELMAKSIRSRSTRVFSFLLEKFPNIVRPDTLLRDMMKYNRLGMLKIVLDKYVDRLTNEDLEDAVSYLERFKSVPSVVEMIRLIQDELRS